MKRTFYLAALLLFSHQVYSQSDFVFPDPITEVVKIDSTNKKELYNRARAYFATEFKSAKDVVQYENAEEGKIIGKGTVEIGGLCFGNYEKGYISFELTIEVKDNRYKYSITKVSHQALQDKYTGGLVVNEVQQASNMMLLNSCWKKVRKQALADMQSLADHLKVVMQKVSKEKQEDW